MEIICITPLRWFSFNSPMSPRYLSDNANVIWHSGHCLRAKHRLWWQVKIWPHNLLAHIVPAPRLPVKLHPLTLILSSLCSYSVRNSLNKTHTCAYQTQRQASHSSASWLPVWILQPKRIYSMNSPRFLAFLPLFFPFSVLRFNSVSSHLSITVSLTVPTKPKCRVFKVEHEVLFNVV